jgi:hypothetical protein
VFRGRADGRARLWPVRDTGYHIAGDGITLDGAGHSVSGNNTNGTTEAAGKLLPGQEVHPFFANLSGQLVELRGWTDASETTQANVMGSQQVLFNGYFNELWGMPYNFG